MAADESSRDEGPDLDREWQDLSPEDAAPREDAAGRARFTGADRPAYWEASADAGSGAERGVGLGGGPGRGPRDWSAPIEEEGHFEGIDPDTAAFYNQPPAPSHPLAPWMWAGTFGSAVFALLFWIGWLPGGGLAMALGFVAMIAFAAVGVFLTAPRDDNVDPTDDGTRL